MQPPDRSATRAATRTGASTCTHVSGTVQNARTAPPTTMPVDLNAPTMYPLTTKPSSQSTHTHRHTNTHMHPSTRMSCPFQSSSATGAATQTNKLTCTRASGAALHAHQEHAQPRHPLNHVDIDHQRKADTHIHPSSRRCGQFPIALAPPAHRATTEM